MVTGVVKAAGKEPCQERGLHRDQTFISLHFLIGTTKTMLKKKKKERWVWCYSFQDTDTKSFHRRAPNRISLSCWERLSLTRTWPAEALHCKDWACLWPVKGIINTKELEQTSLPVEVLDAASTVSEDPGHLWRSWGLSCDKHTGTDVSLQSPAGLSFVGLAH